MENVTEVTKGMIWRIISTILVVTAFLVGSIIYVAFYTSGYSLFQKIAVVLVALILAVAAISVVWVTWAGRRGMMRWKW